MVKDLLRWLNPLWVFVFGMLLLMLSTLLYPTYATLVTDIRAYEAAHSISEGNYWGLAFCLTGTRLIMFVASLLCIVLSALSALHRVRDR